MLNYPNYIGGIL